ncbi:UbiX family flavin prenyltransferase [Cohnella sp.]|uniref:UbiX family flavin prenyltransferase n=1 Tax=Cohnella sp. TaxID=1883426 RepID=UPI003564D54E
MVKAGENGQEAANASRWVVGITGASGAIYGVTLCQQLLAAGCHLHMVISDAGWRVLKEELDWDASHRLDCLNKAFESALTDGRITYHPLNDIGASIASGSFRCEGMVIMPCSMGSLSNIANGASTNLLTRAADVMLKEGRPLLLVPRETPLHAIHLENMLKLARMGVKIIPAMPAFYNGPQTIQDIVFFLVGKVMDSMGITHNLYKRWGPSNG